MKLFKLNRYVKGYVELSTRHITPEDNEKLSHKPGLFIIQNFEPGCMILVPSRKDDPEFWERLEAKTTFSANFKALLSMVEMTGCGYLRLDPDAKVHPKLPKHDW